MVTITVSGSARRVLPAERGTLRIEIREEAPVRTRAVGVVAALHARVATEAAAHVATGAATDWRAGRLTVSTYRRSFPDRQGTETVHVTSAGVDTVFVRFDDLAEWIGTLAPLDGVEILGVEWGLSDDSRREAELQVREGSVLDARERAQAYASALGLASVRPVSLFEPGLRPQAGTTESIVMSGRSAFADASAQAPSLRPEDIEVVAAVSIDFAAD